MRSRLLPSTILLVLAAAVWIAGARVPYRVDTDTALQLKSVQQWLAGASPSPATLRLPDPANLGRDTLLWSNWFPPAFPFVYAPLAAVLPLAGALRATSLLLFLAGSLGWIGLARRIGLPRGVLALFAVSLAGYAFTIGGAASLRTADLLAYAAGPWLAGLALRLSSDDGGPEPSASRLLLGGLAFGATYWVRYSLFLTALPLLAWGALRPVLRERLTQPAPKRWPRRLAALGAGFALPVLLLFAFNLWQSGDLTESATGTRSAWDVGDPRPGRPGFLALSLLGAPGLALFQNDLWMTHLTFFSDARLPGLAGFDRADRLLLKSLLGIPVTAALVWGLARARRRLPGPAVALAAALLAGFYLSLTAVSLLVGYNYLANEPRLTAGLMPLVQALVLAGWTDRDRSSTARAGLLPIAFRTALLAVLFAAPLAFAGANFLRNDLSDRLSPRYAASPTGLYTPELSARDVPGVQSAVAAVLRSPRDLVVLAGPTGWGSSFVMWLELSQRTLPVGTYAAPLGARFQDAAELRGSRSLRASADLRVVLVVVRDLVEAGWLPRLQARFPQARQWRQAAVPADSNVVIYFSDLEAP